MSLEPRTRALTPVDFSQLRRQGTQIQCYHELPLPYSADNLGVFSRQLALWKEFRRWQSDNETIERMWQQEKDRLRKRGSFREVPGGSFQEYVEAVSRRLRKHDFNDAFELLEDPTQQGERTTWIEYLAFNYWWLERRNDADKHCEAWHNTTRLLSHDSANKLMSHSTKSRKQRQRLETRGKHRPVKCHGRGGRWSRCPRHTPKS
ncbi:hypothetical protein F4678DRAFT_451126 [Xylaria arbuscula]|nr:hypothetical protein F4678DRAFT_451126 [Xylaria arbuscula]